MQTSKRIEMEFTDPYAQMRREGAMVIMLASLATVKWREPKTNNEKSNKKIKNRKANKRARRARKRNKR